MTRWPLPPPMARALELAQASARAGEVPVGAVVVKDGAIVAEAHNAPRELTDPTAHAEILAITAASNFLGNKYLNACTLYVTVEPCVMCAGALYWAQLQRIVFATPDPKGGYRRFGQQLLHPRTEMESGILAHECANLMTEFFLNKRN